jgi:hypothetical protein
MRSNSADIAALPEFALIDTPSNGKWAVLKAPLSRLIQLRRDHASTQNENIWATPSPAWLGLGEQQLHAFLASGVADKPLATVKSTLASLPQIKTALSSPRAAVSGSYWDTPSVLANLPLSARARVRAKLPPKHYHLCITFSASVDSDNIGRRLARLIAAVSDYTKAGGTCVIDVAYIAQVTSATGASGMAVQFTLNASDLSACAVGISPAFFRCVAGPIMTAFSDANRDCLYIPQTCPLPGSWLFVGGRSSDSLDAFDKIAKELQLS